jgi:iron(III) transport system ATP-binding protein
VVDDFPDAQGGEVSTSSTAGSLHLERISHSYGSHQVLHDVTLTCPAGTSTAIVGPSGSGKTSLLRIVAGFLRPDAGTVQLDGADITARPAHRRSIGLVAQDGGLFPHLSVGGNVSFGLPRSQRTRERIAELLELVSLPHDYASRRPDQLSGGQQQRVALARALGRSPQIILLDEPFSALDAGLRERTRKAVQRVLRSTGTTALLVTHDQDEALSFADTVAVLQEGTLRQAGAPEEIYGLPADLGTAQFLGEAVVLDSYVSKGSAECSLGTVPLRNEAPTGFASLLLRPEQIAVKAPGHGVLGLVLDADYFGHDTTALVRIHGREEEVRVRQLNAEPLEVGETVGLQVTGTGVAYPP